MVDLVVPGHFCMWAPELWDIINELYFILRSEKRELRMEIS
jgi:hypothetical protein